jgi:chromosome partitioning protein
MGHTIAIAQHKGGVGKTTSCINIAACLRNKGYKVLLIDMDAQANLTEILGLESYVSIADALNGNRPLPIIQKDGLDIVPSSLDLADAEAKMYGRLIGREHIVKGLLADVSEQYDFVIMDCPPSLGLLTINALTAASDVIIPVQSEFLAIRGLSSLLEIIKLVKSNLNSNLSIFGVFVTQYDNRKVLNRDISGALQEMFKQELFNTRIRDNVALAEQHTAKTDIFKYAPGSNGAADYESLTQEILARYKKPVHMQQTKTKRTKI